MSRMFNPFIIGAMALFLLILALGATTGANSTGGAPMTMCMDCHGMPKGAEIRVEKLPRAYLPGSVYEISLRVVSGVKSESDTQGGFAVTASDGELIVSDQKTTQKSGDYITHTAEGTLLRSWNFKWKAPPEKKNVTLTISAVAANGDFAPANDAFSRREFIIQAK